jgi:hypothetical protein
MSYGNSEQHPEPDQPFIDIRRTIREIAVAEVIAILITFLVALIGLGLAWYAIREDIETTKDIIRAECIQNNALRDDIRVIALTASVPAHQLTALRRVSCTDKAIEGRAGLLR